MVVVGFCVVQEMGWYVFCDVLFVLFDDFVIVGLINLLIMVMICDMFELGEMVVMFLLCQIEVGMILFSVEGLIFVFMVCESIVFFIC